MRGALNRGHLSKHMIIDRLGLNQQTCVQSAQPQLSRGRREASDFGGRLPLDGSGSLSAQYVMLTEDLHVGIAARLNQAPS